MSPVSGNGNAVRRLQERGIAEHPAAAPKREPLWSSRGLLFPSPLTNAPPPMWDRPGSRSPLFVVSSSAPSSSRRGAESRAQPPPMWDRPGCDSPIFADQVEAIRPGGVGKLDPVIHLIDQGGEANIEPPHTQRCMIFFVCDAAGVGKRNPFLLIRFVWQALGRVRLANIDQHELDFALIHCGHLIQGGDLPPEQRSGIGAEDEGHRLLAGRARQSTGGRPRWH